MISTSQLSIRKFIKLIITVVTLINVSTLDSASLQPSYAQVGTPVVEEHSHDHDPRPELFEQQVKIWLQQNQLKAASSLNEVGFPFPGCQTWYVYQGYKGYTHQNYYPNGIDNTYAFDLVKDSWSNTNGTAGAVVIAAASGPVSTWDGNDNGVSRGWDVYIGLSDGNIVYNAHLTELTDTVNDGWVNKGEPIGKVYNFGSNNASHLHFQVGTNAQSLPLTFGVWNYPTPGPIQPGGPPLSSGEWRGTEIKPSCGNNLLFYSAVNGIGEIYNIDDQGNLASLTNYSNWRTSWYTIVPGKFNGDSYIDLLFYDATAGQGNLYSTDGQGHLADLSTYPGWRKTWSVIVPGYFNNDNYTDLLFYSATEGRGDIYRTDGQGTLIELSTYPNWRKTWSAIVPGNFDGDSYTDLLFYDAIEGRGEIYRTDGQGHLVELSTYPNWRKTWSAIVPGNFDGDNYTDLLFYDATEGRGEIYRTDGQGHLVDLSIYPSWRKTWSAIVPGNFNKDAYTDLLFYEAATGLGTLYSTSGTGNLNFAQDYTWRTDWNIIIFGNTSSTMTVVRLDRIIPTGSIASPANGSVTNNPIITITANASDNLGGSGVNFVDFHARYDGVWHKVGYDNTVPYQYTWNANSITDQPITLSIHVFDRAGNVFILPEADTHTITLNRNTLTKRVYLPVVIR